MSQFSRPRGPGIYGEIFLPASTRRSVLKETVKDHNFIPAQLDPNPIPHVPTAAQVQRELGRRLADPRPSEIDRHEVEAIRRGLSRTQELQPVA